MKVTPYISAENIQNRIRELAVEIDRFLGLEEAVIIANLKGSVIFFSDLIRALSSNHISLDFIATESYQGTTTTGEVRITHDLSTNIAGKKVLLVEDILDTGLTLETVNRYIKEMHHPSAMRVCVLLNKQARRAVDLKADYIGYDIEDHFVVGYGLDYQQKYRNLPYIGLLDIKTAD